MSDLDGGLTALGGFFLQFVGTGEGVVTGFWVEETADSTPDTDKNTLFGIEIEDTDAYSRRVTSDDRLLLRLVQFKFSLSSPSDPVTPKEMAEILDKMQKFVDARFQDEKVAGRSIDVTFVMATNRPRSTDMETVWKDRLDNPSNPYFSKYSEYPNFREQLQKCQWQEVNEGQARARIEDWGRAFGMSDEELKSGILRLTGLFMSRVTTGQRLFTIGDLEKIFTDCQTPRRLNSHQTREDIKRNVRDFLRTLYLPLPKEPSDETDEIPSLECVRHDIFAELNDAINTRALVLLTGDGGNGKSTLLAFLLYAWASESFVCGTGIDDLTDNWISKTISEWRGDRRFDGEGWEASLLRLMGFSDERPVLLLALDALDENQAAQKKISEIRRLLNIFRREDERGQPPRATLVVTCRRREDLDGMLGDSANQLFAPAEMRQPGKEISVPIFSGDDLRQLLEQRQGGAERLTDDVRSRLMATLRQSGASRPSISSASLTPLRPSSHETLKPRSTLPSVNPEILEALRHPIVWGCFCYALKDGASQNAALDGDEAALNCVGFELLDWFKRKCVRRCNIHVDEEEVHEILLAVARQFGEFNQAYQRSQWRSAAKGCASLAPAPVHILRQAISAGLVTGSAKSDDSEWEWRHPFWAHFLCAQATAQAT